MTRDESLTIVGMVLNTWPGPQWSAEQMDAYAKGIQHMHPQHTTAAVARASRELKYRPSIAELSEFERIERRLAEPDKREPLPKAQEMPEWTQVWAWLRWTVGDWRTLPQQDHGLGVSVSHDEYQRLRQTWLAAGSPKMTAEQIARKVGAT